MKLTRTGEVAKRGNAAELLGRQHSDGHLQAAELPHSHLKNILVKFPASPPESTINHGSLGINVGSVRLCSLKTGSVRTGSSKNVFRDVWMVM